MSGTLSELISVIVPVYNIEDYLPKCLETICHQTYRNLEIILVDDGSTDSSGRICDEYAKKDPRITVIHQENKKRGLVRNTGLKYAHGEYIMFVDGDDYLHLDAAKCMIEAINKDGVYDLAIVNWKATKASSEDISSPIMATHRKLNSEDLFKEIQSYSTIWGKLYRKSLIQDIQFRNFSMAQDYDYNIRVFQNVNKAILINSILYYYVQRSNSAIHREKSPIEGRKCQVDILLDNLNNLPQSKGYISHYLLRELYTYMIMLLNLSWKTEERKSSVKYCHQNEKTMRKIYWSNRNIGVVEKVAMTLNIRYPYLISFIKKMTKDRLSWHNLKSF